jgi:hypothetical protein
MSHTRSDRLYKPRLSMPDFEKSVQATVWLCCNAVNFGAPQGRLYVSGHNLCALVAAPSINCDLGLDETKAAAVGSALMPVVSDAPLFTAVGSQEIEGFHIQDHLIASCWPAVHRHTTVCTGAHHFSVLEGLLDPKDGLFRSTITITMMEA